jgi:hypothetical protein
LLQLLNTGQSGSLFTLHASSAKQALAGLANCVLQSGADLSYRAIKTSIGHCVNVVIQLEQRPGRRFVSQVVEVKGFDEEADEFDLSTVFGREQKSPRIAKTSQGGQMGTDTSRRIPDKSHPALTAQEAPPQTLDQVRAYLPRVTQSRLLSSR